MAAVTIPVMAKVRIGHFVEAQILESLGVDFIDESEGNCRFVHKMALMPPICLLVYFLQRLVKILAPERVRHLYVTH